jgi:MoaA/NifB/PqqE/SkfB family radical SAM enzyme
MFNQPIAKADLDYKKLHNFLDCPSGEAVETIRLCGDYGDSIYYPKLFDFIKEFRHKQFYIQTNGSRRHVEWWKQLSSLLLPGDRIYYSIDGLEEDNAKYRVNSDWDSLVKGLEIISQCPATLLCETLIFNYNYDKLDKIREFAESYGMEWTSVKTMRFGNEGLRPPVDHVLQEEEYKTDYHLNNPIEIAPRCFEAAVITSGGLFLPCDWIRHPFTYYKTDLHKDKERWTSRLNIENITLDDALAVLTEWTEHVKAKGIAGTADVLCKMKCRKCQ